LGVLDLELKIVEKTGDVEGMDEKDVQKAFEKNLAAIQEGLRFVGSSVPIGTGIIDTFALDDEKNPVIIEFKAPGVAAGKDALVQVMSYYGWLVEDENRINYLRDYVRKSKPELIHQGDELGDPRLVVVASQFDDEIKTACWALEPATLLVSYLVIRESDSKVSLVPSVVLDTSSGGEPRRPLPKTEEDHIKEHENLRSTYFELKRRVLERLPETKFNPAPRDYIGLMRRRTFCALRLKKEWIRLDLLLTQEEAKNSKRYRAYPSGGWGYVHVRSTDDIDEELMSMIITASGK